MIFMSLELVGSKFRKDIYQKIKKKTLEKTLLLQSVDRKCLKKIFKKEGITRKKKEKKKRKGKGLTI